MGFILFVLSFCLMTFGSLSRYSAIRVPSVFIGFTGVMASVVVMFSNIFS